MKFIVSFVLALLFSSHTFATNLCEDSCEIIITFPDGGSIQAVDAMTITFGSDGDLELGETGTVNTNPQPISIDFSVGGSLSLAEGDSITFDSDGWFKLGTGGNIDYTSIAIDTTGDAMITAVGGQREIVIKNVRVMRGNVVFVGGRIVLGESLTGDGNIFLESDRTISLTIDSTVPSAAEPGATDYSFQDSSNNVTLSAGGSIELSFSGVPLDVSTGVIPEGYSFASLDLNLEIVPVNVNLPATATFDPLTAEEFVFTPQFLEQIDDGISLPTEDGQSCTMTAGECISATGEKYDVVDGELVAEKKGSGLINPVMLLLLAGLLLFKQRRRLNLIRA